MLSVRNWRMRRVRLAPRAWRTATSRVRVSDRASKRFATLTIEISSTSNTAPCSSHSVVASEPTRSAWNGVRDHVVVVASSCGVGPPLAHLLEAVELLAKRL